MAEESPEPRRVMAVVRLDGRMTSRRSATFLSGPAPVEAGWMFLSIDAARWSDLGCPREVTVIVKARPVGSGETSAPAPASRITMTMGPAPTFEAGYQAGLADGQGSGA